MYRKDKHDQRSRNGFPSFSKFKTDVLEKLNRTDRENRSFETFSKRDNSLTTSITFKKFLFKLFFFFNEYNFGNHAVEFLAKVFSPSILRISPIRKLFRKIFIKLNAYTGSKRSARACKRQRNTFCSSTNVISRVIERRRNSFNGRLLGRAKIRLLFSSSNLNISHGRLFSGSKFPRTDE